MAFLEKLTFEKVVTILAISTGVSFGLCGIGMIASLSADRRGFVGGLFNVMWVTTIAAFWMSLLGLLLTVGVWIVVSIIRSATLNPHWPRPASYEPRSASNELSITTPPDPQRKDTDD